MSLVDKERRNAYMREWNARRQAASPRRVCACGCGETIPSVRTDGKPQKYAVGHSWAKGKVLGYQKERVNEWHSRHRARVIKGPGGCELEHIGGCGVPMIEVHHLDSDPHNNDPDNLMRLCRSHHKLVEHGRIDLADPVMPRYYISAGQRRYEFAYPSAARHPDALP